MIDIPAIQAILAIALLAGWAYASTGKRQKSIRGKRGGRDGGSPNFKSADSNGKHKEHSGSKDRKRRRSGGKLQK